MASNKNPFLDDLFPDPMRARKARIFKGYEKVSNTAAFRFSALSSKVKRQLPAFFYSLPRGSLKTATVA